MSDTAATQIHPNHDIPTEKIGSCPYCASRNQCFICSKGVSTEKKNADASEIPLLKSSEEDVTSRKWCPGKSYPRQLIIRGQNKKTPTLSSSPSQDAKILAKDSVDELDEEFSLDYPSDHSPTEKDDEVENPVFDVYNEQNDDAAASGDVDEDEYLEMAKLLEQSDNESQHEDTTPNENILEWGDGGFDYENYEKSLKQPAEYSEPTSTLDTSNASSSLASVVTPNVTSDSEDVNTSELNERDNLIQLGKNPESASEVLNKAPKIATGTHQEGDGSTESIDVNCTESAYHSLNESSNIANEASGEEVEAGDECAEQGAVTEVGTTEESDPNAPPKELAAHVEVNDEATNGSGKVGSTASTTASSSPSQTATSVVSPTHSGEVPNAADDVTSEAKKVNTDELSNEHSLDNSSESSQHELDDSMQSNKVANSAIEEMVRAVHLAKSTNHLTAAVAAATKPEYQPGESIEPTALPEKEKEAGCTTQKGGVIDENHRNDTIKERKVAEVGETEQIYPIDVHRHDVTTLEVNNGDATESEKVASIEYHDVDHDVSTNLLTGKQSALQENKESRNSNPTSEDENDDNLSGNQHEDGDLTMGKRVRRFDIESEANAGSSIGDVGDRRFGNDDLSEHSPTREAESLSYDSSNCGASMSTVTCGAEKVNTDGIRKQDSIDSSIERARNVQDAPVKADVTPISTIVKQDEGPEESTEANQQDNKAVFNTDAAEKAQINSDKLTKLSSTEMLCKEKEGASNNIKLLRNRGSLVMDYEVAQSTNKRRKSMGLINKLNRTEHGTIDLTIDGMNSEHVLFQRKKNTRYNLRCQGLSSSIKNISDTVDKNPSKKRKMNEINTAASENESEYSRFSRTDDDESMSPVCLDNDEEQISNWETKNEPKLFEGENDEYCYICEDGGDLLCCDYCCKSFHMHCHVPPLDNVPHSKKWMCCECKAPREWHC